MATHALRRARARTHPPGDGDSSRAPASTATSSTNARTFVPPLASEWVGARGEHVRVPVEIVDITDIGHRIQRYLVGQIGTHNLLEWSSARRYGFRVGDQVKLSGLVQAHIRRDDVFITALHECFNPLRMT